MWKYVQMYKYQKFKLKFQDFSRIIFAWIS